MKIVATELHRNYAYICVGFPHTILGSEDGCSKNEKHMFTTFLRGNVYARAVLKAHVTETLTWEG